MAVSFCWRAVASFPLKSQVQTALDIRLVAFVGDENCRVSFTSQPHLRKTKCPSWTPVFMIPTFSLVTLAVQKNVLSRRSLCCLNCMLVRLAVFSTVGSDVFSEVHPVSLRHVWWFLRAVAVLDTCAGPTRHAGRSFLNCSSGYYHLCWTLFR